jgi:hypothetical protein
VAERADSPPRRNGAERFAMSTGANGIWLFLYFEEA